MIAPPRPTATSSAARKIRLSAGGCADLLTAQHTERHAITLRQGRAQESTEDSFVPVWITVPHALLVRLTGGSYAD
jgi:hypothetical protein